MKLNPIFTILALCFVSLSLSAGELTFHKDFNSAKKAAAESGKPIVTVFSATWCPPCQQMKQSVYPSATVAPYHDKFVWAYLDADKKSNRALMTKYGVEGIPHITFVSPKGKRLGNTVGAMSATEFTKVLTSILNKPL